MTDTELIEKIIKLVRMSTWSAIQELGINIQQAQKIRKGKPVHFRKPTLERLRKKLKVSA